MVDTATQPILQPIRVGDLDFPNRAVVAATTRLRAGITGVPNDLLVEYYTARSGAGLILSECVAVSADGNAFPGAACLYNDDHVTGWKRVIESVHAKGGRIFAQIFHGGRAAHPDQIGGVTPLSSSAIAIDGTVHTQNGSVPHVVPKEATNEDIQTVIKSFRRTAELAKAAGFDGIEIHGANGYIIDQFLRDSVLIENRARLLLEVVEQVSEVFTPHRIGVKLSPNGTYNDLSDSDPIALYQYVVKQLSERKVAFIEVAEYFTFDATNAEIQERFFANLEHKNIRAFLKPHFSGAYIANTGYDQQRSNDTIRAGEADLISFGSLYIANADLVEKFQSGKTPNSVANIKDFSKLWTNYFYGSDGLGYTDLSVYEP
eukprot:403374598